MVPRSRNIFLLPKDKEKTLKRRMSYNIFTKEFCMSVLFRLPWYIWFD